MLQIKQVTALSTSILALLLCFAQLTYADEGDRYISSDIDLDGHLWVVEGDLIHSDGRLNINGGRLVVKGDYRIQTPTDVAGEYTYSEGYLHMTDPASVVLVEGDFIRVVAHVISLKTII